MLLLGIDLESDSLDTQTASVLEFGIVLYDWDTKTPVKIISELIDPGFNSDEEYSVPDEITSITGITTEQVLAFGDSERDVLSRLAILEKYADYYVGHNCNMFDRPLLEARRRKHGLDEWPSNWIDTIVDVKYPPLIKTRNLKHLAAEHGFLNPLPHRAVFDVLTMFKVMEQYDLEAIIARSNEPTVYLQAIVSFDEKEKAKERGYRWFSSRKIWWKAFKLSDSLVEAEECGFKTMAMERAPE